MQHPPAKEKIYRHLINLLSQKIETAESAIQSAKDSRDNETKSSVGDKYETGRAMMQIEQQKNEVQLSKALTLKKILEQINIDADAANNHQAQLGSLVITPQAFFFLSIGIGKIAVESQKVFAISMASPMGKILYGKKAGDQISFQGKMVEVLEVL